MHPEQPNIAPGAIFFLLVNHGCQNFIFVRSWLNVTRLNNRNSRPSLMRCFNANSFVFDYWKRKSLSMPKIERLRELFDDKIEREQLNHCNITIILTLQLEQLNHCNTAVIKIRRQSYLDVVGNE